MYRNDVTHSYEQQDGFSENVDFLDPFSAEPAQPTSHTASIGRRFIRFFREIVGAGIKGIVLALLLIYFVAQAHVVHGHSMEPTLHTNQRLIVEKISYRLFVPQRGDIVVIDPQNEQERLIKRVIGLAGDTVEIRNSRLYLNGQPLDESYLPLRTPQANFGPVIVPMAHVFVLGDNRNNSNDSRYFGAVDIAQITGRAWVSYWPMENLGFVE